MTEAAWSFPRPRSDRSHALCIAELGQRSAAQLQPAEGPGARCRCASVGRLVGIATEMAQPVPSDEIDRRSTATGSNPRTPGPGASKVGSD
jgi:hypothetical protein